MQGLRLGDYAGILELLRLVQGAREARLTARPGSVVSNLIDGLLVLDGAFEPDSQAADVGCGSIVAFTERAPDKDTENEDTIAVIPWGPEAVVLAVADGAGGLPAGKRASLTAVSSLVEALSVPGGPGVRFDTLVYPGCTVPPFYDSLLGKLIVWDESRESALRRLAGALAELEITGIKTTKPLHQALADDEAVKSASFHTKFLEDWLESDPPGLLQHAGGG